jgi:hypothetical protein
MIIDGLPPGTTIELDPRHTAFVCWPFACGEPGGSLGHERELFELTLVLLLSGAGELDGFRRTLRMPMEVETHTGPRTPGDPVQSFDADVYNLQGAISGDPDFASLQIIAGTGSGLPSPGYTTLTDQGDGTFVVDSFFDVTYQIDFVGAPGGQLDGLSGSTLGQLRLAVYDRAFAPAHNITIVKDAIPDDPTDFPFTGLASFSLDDDSDPTLPDRRTFHNLTPGVHVVTEMVPGGWWLDSLACVDPDGGCAGT